MPISDATLLFPLEQSFDRYGLCAGSHAPTGGKPVVTDCNLFQFCVHCSVYSHTWHSCLWAYLVKLTVSSHAHITLLNLPGFFLRSLNYLFYSISLYVEILHRVVLRLSKTIFCSAVYKGTPKARAYTQPQANPVISFFFEIINASSVLRNPCSLFFFPDIMSRLCLSLKTTCSNFPFFRCLFSNPLDHLQAFC